MVTILGERATPVFSTYFQSQSRLWMQKEDGVLLFVPVSG
jgi:hypothetical protein